MTPDRFDLPPEIAAELAALPGARDPSYLERLESVSLEVLLIARRRAVAEVLRRRIDEIVAKRAVRVIRASAIRNGKAPPGEEDEVADEAVVLFWEAIQGESFFEIKFNKTAKDIAKRAGGRIRRGKRGERERKAEHGLPGIDYPESPANADALEIAEARMLIRAEFPALPDEHARSLVLRYYQDLPVFSRDRDVVTVASTLGCSRRKAQQLLADGVAILRARMNRGTDDDE